MASVKVAEYLGQRTDISNPFLTPVPRGVIPQCPFMNNSCTKVKKNLKPVCSVRKGNDLWIVCKDRLCSTIKTPPLSNHQKDILFKVAKIVYGETIREEEVLVKREVPIQNIESQKLSADYVMRRNGYSGDGPNRIILEMQGGGETSNTGKLTKLVDNWENNPNRSNEELAKVAPKVGTIENNAWKRQSDQFFIKGNVAKQTGGRLVFCVGVLLYNYLMARVRGHNLQDLRNYNWDLGIIAFKDITEGKPPPGNLPLVVDNSRLFFTNYGSFVQILTNQGGPRPELFEGEFKTLNGSTITFD